ncbi:MAG: hypothetical protein KAR13_20000, partial [Desulfobulbaceae bacterium]|nr:hypothetical protein [Desulfobulbaceae bacterium]
MQRGLANLFSPAQETKPDPFDTQTELPVNSGDGYGCSLSGLARTTDGTIKRQTYAGGFLPNGSMESDPIDSFKR